MCKLRFGFCCVIRVHPSEELVQTLTAVFTIMSQSAVVSRFPLLLPLFHHRYLYIHHSTSYLIHKTTYVPAKQLILISITYWDFVAVDLRAWLCGYLFGSVDDEQSSCSASREGHLDACFTCSHIWINSEAFKKQDWTYCTMSEMDRTRTERQGSDESSTYQEEFLVMKEATEYIRALR
eukprot:scaffold11907_cov93-Skeletonema_dohrnii-CCMP3373.AAC.3